MKSQHELANVIRALRRELFNRTEYRSAHERECETPEQEADREERNRQRLAKFEAQTERIIEG